MNDKEMLHAIVTADSAAAARYAAALKKQKMLEAGGRGAENAIRSAAMEQADKLLEAKKAESEAQVAEQLAALDKKIGERQAALDRQFDQIRDDCAERIFRAAVGLS